jgi:hypothetical protein
MIEPVLDYYIESYQVFADKFISRHARTRAAIALSVGAALVACFLAFRDEYNATIQAQAQTATVLGERDEARRQLAASSPGAQQSTIQKLQAELDLTKSRLAAVQDLYASRHLSQEQRNIIQEIAKSPDDEKYSISLFQPSDCRDCNEYSTEFIETLSAPAGGWKIKNFATMHGGLNPHFRGIAVLVKDPHNPSRAAVALANALNSASIKFVAIPAEDSFNVANNEVGLVIPPKEGQ